MKKKVNLKNTVGKSVMVSSSADKFKAGDVAIVVGKKAKIVGVVPGTITYEYLNGLERAKEKAKIRSTVHKKER